jgi:hypothetical protein
MNPRLILTWGSTVLVFAIGCGAGRTLVVKPSETRLRVASLNVSEANSPVSVPTEVKSAFQEKLEQLLYGEGGFQKGKELTIRYRFIQFDSGNQFARWFTGGIGNTGEGSLTVEAKFFDSSDQEVGTIQTEGKIGSGFFGGGFGFAVDKAAEKIAEYTKINYK